MGYPTSAMQAQGVKIKRGDGATPTEAFVLIAEIATFTGPTESAKAIEVTNLDSESKEFINGLMDPGELSFEGNFVAGDVAQKGLRADLLARVKRNFKMELTDGDPLATPTPIAPTTISFTAVVTDFSIKGGTDDKLTFNCTLRISGTPQITYATP